MEGVYFIDEEHQQNFERLLFKWKQAKSNMEYMTACYILAVPMIFKKIERKIESYTSPVKWVYEYLEWHEEYNEDWEKYSNAIELHPDHDAWIDRKPFDLTGSMVHLGKLSLNLWNSYDDFNLMECMASLDDKNFKVLKCAIDIRMGLFK